MTLQEEIQTVLKEIQDKVSAKQVLSDKELEMLFISSLIEEEAE